MKARPFSRNLYFFSKVNESYTCVNVSVYHRHVSNWLRFFPLNQMLFLDGDKLITEPWGEMRRAEDFLGLEHQIKRQSFDYKFGESAV